MAHLWRPVSELWRRATDSVSKVCPMKIHYDKATEAIFCEYRDMSSIFFQGPCRESFQRALLSHHLSSGCAEPHGLNVAWQYSQLSECQLRAFEKAGSCCSVNPGYQWDEDRKSSVISKYQKHQARQHPDARRPLCGIMFSRVSTGFSLFSVPSKAVEYGATVWLDPGTHVDHLQPHMQVLRKPFLKAAMDRGLTRLQALEELDIVQEYGIRACMVVDLQGIGMSKVACFVDHEVALDIAQNLGKHERGLPAEDPNVVLKQVCELAGVDKIEDEDLQVVACIYSNCLEVIVHKGFPKIPRYEDLPKKVVPYHPFFPPFSRGFHGGVTSHQHASLPPQSTSGPDISLKENMSDRATLRITIEAASSLSGAPPHPSSLQGDQGFQSHMRSFTLNHPLFASYKGEIFALSCGHGINFIINNVKKKQSIMAYQVKRHHYKFDQDFEHVPFMPKIRIAFTHDTQVTEKVLLMAQIAIVDYYGQSWELYDEEGNLLGERQ